MFIINLVAVDWYVQNCEVTFYLWFGDFCFVFVFWTGVQNFECDLFWSALAWLTGCSYNWTDVCVCVGGGYVYITNLYIWSKRIIV